MFPSIHVACEYYIKELHASSPHVKLSIHYDIKGKSYLNEIRRQKTEIAGFFLPGDATAAEAAIH